MITNAPLFQASIQYRFISLIQATSSACSLWWSMRNEDFKSWLAAMSDQWPNESSEPTIERRNMPPTNSHTTLVTPSVHSKAKVLAQVRGRFSFSRLQLLREERRPRSSPDMTCTRVQTRRDMPHARTKTGKPSYMIKLLHKTISKSLDPEFVCTGRSHNIWDDFKRHDRLRRRRLEYLAP
jgi:hypothetical protein